MVNHFYVLVNCNISCRTGISPQLDLYDLWGRFMVTTFLVTETSAEPVKLNFLFLLPNQIQYRT